MAEDVKAYAVVDFNSGQYLQCSSDPAFHQQHLSGYHNLQLSSALTILGNSDSFLLHSIDSLSPWAPASPIKTNRTLLID